MEDVVAAKEKQLMEDKLRLEKCRRDAQARGQGWFYFNPSIYCLIFCKSYIEVEGIRTDCCYLIVGYFQFLK